MSLNVPVTPHCARGSSSSGRREPRPPRGAGSGRGILWPHQEPPVFSLLPVLGSHLCLPKRRLVTRALSLGEWDYARTVFRSL